MIFFELGRCGDLSIFSTSHFKHFVSAKLLDLGKPRLTRPF